MTEYRSPLHPALYFNSSGQPPSLLQPARDLIIQIVWRMDLQMMGKPARCRLHYFLPAWGRIPAAKADRKHQRRAPAVQIFARHPGIGKCFISTKGNLALLHHDFHSPQGFHHFTQTVKEAAGFFVFAKVFIQKSYLSHFIDV